MLDIEIDGIYCSKCREIHPTLYWHEKYNEYLMPAVYCKKYKSAAVRFGVICSEEYCKEKYHSVLDSIKIKYVDDAGECDICNSVTNFMMLKGEHYVCADECLSKVKEIE